MRWPVRGRGAHHAPVATLALLSLCQLACANAPAATVDTTRVLSAQQFNNVLVEGAQHLVILNHLDLRNSASTGDYEEETIEALSFPEDIMSIRVRPACQLWVICLCRFYCVCPFPSLRTSCLLACALTAGAVSTFFVSVPLSVPLPFPEDIMSIRVRPGCRRRANCSVPVLVPSWFASVCDPLSLSAVSAGHCAV